MLKLAHAFDRGKREWIDGTEKMLSSIPQVFPFFRKGGPFIQHGRENSLSSATSLENDSSSTPLKVITDREVYRPGDLIIATVEVHNGKCLVDSNARSELGLDVRDAIQIEHLIVEVKGIEKLDTQWVVTQKPSPGAKQRRGERAIFDSTPTSVVSNMTLGPGCTKTYLIRVALPKVLPPSFRGTVARYLYYLVVILRGRRVNFKNDHSLSQFTPLHLESRIPLNIWTLPNNSGVMNEDGQSKDYLGANGIVPTSPLRVEIFWKEKENDSDWARANELMCGTEDDYGGNSHVKGSLDLLFERSLVLQSPVATPRSSFHAEQSGFGSFRMPSPLTDFSSEPVYEAGGDASSQFGTLADRPSFRRKPGHPHMNSGSHSLYPLNHQPGNTSVSSGTAEFNKQLEPSNIEPVIGASPSETFIRGRSYNIRIEDQVLVRFSPKNSDSTYYFGDTIGGVLTFFHEEGPRRCLEVSVTLETLETVNPAFIHPSRKQSPVITKIQSDYHEVVADIVQTHFMFSIPMDGPMSFSTPHVSLQWVLRFEFETTSKHVDWTKYEHPLLIEEREKGEWVLPITVQAPLSRTHVALTRKERLFSPNGFWVGSPGSAGRTQTHSSFLSGWETSNGGDGTSNYVG